jgi:hypothetical protein
MLFTMPRSHGRGGEMERQKYLIVGCIAQGVTGLPNGGRINMSVYGGTAAAGKSPLGAAWP